MAHPETFAYALVLILARVMPATLWIPLFADRILGSGMLRMMLLVLLACGLYPLTAQAGTPDSLSDWGVALVRESMIGAVLGMGFGAPYFAVMACGEMIDNQRGATIANTIDPASGVEASPLASFLSLCWTTVFATGGGLVAFLTSLADSYRCLPLGMPFSLDAATTLSVSTQFGQSLLLGSLAALPAVVAMLLTEMLLGVLSRFAPQLNAFSLALTVKSLIACAVLLAAFGSHFFERFDRLLDVPAHEIAKACGR